MLRKQWCALCMILATAVFSSAALAEGEDVLAFTGQYTFFIKPQPGSCVTYYQKMVPCVLEETVTSPRHVKPVFPVPVSSTRGMPVVRTETPVGCADGVGPCLHCFPRPASRPGTTDLVVPVMRSVGVPTIEVVPRCVKQRVMRPQWFEVKETPRPPKGARKTLGGG